MMGREWALSYYQGKKPDTAAYPVCTAYGTRKQAANAVASPWRKTVDHDLSEDAKCIGHYGRKVPRLQIWAHELANLLRAGIRFLKTFFPIFLFVGLVRVVQFRRGKIPPNQPGYPGSGGYEEPMERGMDTNSVSTT